ncbi:MAG: P1 family peptidase [Chloroflexia bacterium]|nr:P1 family peptidase [Chloroflexia bacterium]
MKRPRAQELNLGIPELPRGPLNAITDVAGVRVGHTTLVDGEGPLRPGEGPVRTGVTVILPHGGNLFREKVRAAAYTINGFGKATGLEQVRELGEIEAPIALTNTLNVGLVADALVQHAVRQSPEIGIRTGTVNVVVGETNDGYLNDLQGRHVRAEHVWAAIEAASDGPAAEGAVGAGTGCTCFGWKGGIGSASRVLPAEWGGFTVGALVQANFGRPCELTIAGVPVGRNLQPPSADAPADGSIVIVLATDAPLTSRQLRRLCVRAAAGLARTGSTIGNGSGDFVLAFSTAWRIPHQAGDLTRPQTVLSNEYRVLNRLFPAVVESVEEAILNALLQAQTTVGRDGHVRHALPLDKVLALVRQYRPPTEEGA